MAFLDKKVKVAFLDKKVKVAMDIQNKKDEKNIHNIKLFKDVIKGLFLSNLSSKVINRTI